MSLTGITLSHKGLGIVPSLEKITPALYTMHPRSIIRQNIRYMDDYTCYNSLLMIKLPTSWSRLKPEDQKTQARDVNNLLIIASSQFSVLSRSAQNLLPDTT